MAKKSNKKNEPLNLDLNRDIKDIDPKVLDKARKDMRAEMKEKFDKWITISDEDATDEDLQNAKNDFQDKVNLYTDKKYEIAPANSGQALAYAQFLKKFNTTANKWEGGAWKGVITFDKVISKHIEELEANPDNAFEIDYSTLIFLYNTMQNPSGVGLESARVMAEMENFDEETGKQKEGDDTITYSSVLERVYNHIKFLSNIDKMLKLYRERVNIAAAGVKFDFKISDIEEFVQFHDAWLVDNVPNNIEKLKNNLI